MVRCMQRANRFSLLVYEYRIAVNQYTGQSETQTKPVCAASIWWNPCTNLIVYELVGLAQISC
ncbi:hypothetical protein L873DRAFT_1808726, partial [Choiromyces venosus 120613-1]